jgi:hypothetical protein
LLTVKNGVYVIIILINLPENTNKKDIEDFVRPAIEDGHMGGIAIMVQRHPKTLEIKYHGLVRLTPDSVAKRAIKDLNDKQINGRHIDVHEYRTRYWYNDPRVISTKNYQSRNMRKGERRQFL